MTLGSALGRVLGFEPRILEEMTPSSSRRKLLALNVAVLSGIALMATGSAALVAMVTAGSRFAHAFAFVAFVITFAGLLALQVLMQRLGGFALEYHEDEAQGWVPNPLRLIGFVCAAALLAQPLLMWIHQDRIDEGLVERARGRVESILAQEVAVLQGARERLLGQVSATKGAPPAQSVAPEIEAIEAKLGRLGMETQDKLDLVERLHQSHLLSDRLGELWEDGLHTALASLGVVVLMTGGLLFRDGLTPQPLRDYEKQRHRRLRAALRAEHKTLQKQIDGFVEQVAPEQRLPRFVHWPADADFYSTTRSRLAFDSWVDIAQLAEKDPQRFRSWIVRQLRVNRS